MKYLLSALLIWGVSVTGNLEAKSVAKSGGTTLKAKNGGVPSKINYQGWLGSSTDTTGVTGTPKMIFRIYDAVTGGNEKWTETHLSVPVDKGIFNVILGSNAPISSKHFYDDASLWLETQVGNDTLSPRKKFVSVGYAMKSEYANDANDADHADNADSANVAGHSVHADTADYAVAAGGVADTANYAKDSDKLDGQHASEFALATHNHMNESWSTDKGTYGLSKNISVNTSDDVSCAVDSAKNAGTGDTYGGRFYTGGSGAGVKYGVYGLAVGPSGSSKSAYGNFGHVGHSGTGVAYGSYGYAYHSNTGTTYGGRFHGAGTGTGTKYGIYGRADGPAASTKNVYGSYGYANHAGTGDTYGGRFYATGAGNGTKYGIYATTGAGGTGTRYAGYFNGDVNVTGTLTAGTIANVPGIASKHDTRDIPLATADSVAETLVITAPAAGFVVVTLTGLVEFDHTTGTRDLARTSISKGTTLDFTYMASITWPATAETYEYAALPFAVTRVEAVTAGDQTYRFVCDRHQGNAEIIKYQFTAVFYPTSYGTVSKSLTPSPTGDTKDPSTSLK